jgi:hypothetical protein
MSGSGHLCTPQKPDAHAPALFDVKLGCEPELVILVMVLFRKAPGEAEGGRGAPWGFVDDSCAVRCNFTYQALHSIATI